MKRSMTLLTLTLLTATTLGASDNRYAGMQTRSIKALSDEQIASYLAGEGMGFAKAAELNGYPGPKHVLDLAEELQLQPEQIEAIRTIQLRMKEEAQSLGSRLVEAERGLDALFARGDAAAGEVEQAIESIGRMQSDLRFIHIRAHLEVTPILTRHQRVLYAVARGYASDSPQASHVHQH